MSTRCSQNDENARLGLIACCVQVLAEPGWCSMRYCVNNPPAESAGIYPLARKYSMASAVVENTRLAVSVMNGEGGASGFQTTKTSLVASWAC